MSARAAALALLLLPAAASLQAAPQPLAPLSLEEYRGELVRIASSLEKGALDEARADAARLLESRVAFGAETLSPDVTLLAPLARAATAGQAVAGARALRRLADELATAAAGAPSATDPALLERLAQLQAQASLRRGGRIESRLKPLTLTDRAANALEAAGNWCVRVYRRVQELLRQLWPSRSRGRGGRSGLAVSSATTALVAFCAGALMLLALRALRGKRARPLPQDVPQPAASAADDDPLSREAGEWERYAAELRAKGRLREALRAHYHAVLVALFRAGLLFHQKGRTNWEYVAQLGPELRFRPVFIDITRRFDSEWYGRQRTTPEALAEYAAEAGRILRALRAPEAA